MGNHLLICIHNKPAWSAYLLSHVVEVPPHLKVCIYTLTHTYNAHTCNAHTLLQTHTTHATHIIITHMPCTRTHTHTHTYTHMYMYTYTHIHIYTHVYTQHFVCGHCEKPFEGRRHYEKKGEAYCERDYKAVSTSLEPRLPFLLQGGKY